MRCLLLTAFLVIASIEIAWGQIPLPHGKGVITFATVEEGRLVLSTRDEFVERMSPFDRAARLKTDRDVSEKEYLQFAGESVLAWSDDEKQVLTSTLESILPAVAAFSVKLPSRILLIKTSGREEGGAPYTRANAIILPQQRLAEPVAKSQHTLSHELFHIISRANPGLREKLYGAIGFLPCDEVFPPALLDRKITNPDAPRNNHCICLKVQGADQWAMPILYSRTARYDPAKGGEFFSYLEFKFLFIDRNADGTVTRLHEELLAPALMQVRGVTGFYEQVGMNTKYILHPEEILAENFALLLKPGSAVPTLETLARMEVILKE